MLAIAIYFNVEKNTKISELSSETIKNHQYQVSSAILQYEHSTELIFNSIINKDKILSIQKNALESKTDEQRDKYRANLHNELKPLYRNLKEFGLKQLHFHFPDTTSFLRFHKPAKYGDNLQDIRYSLVLANSQLKKISGFEEGRIFNGYRFVYPLFYKKKHIGSVETSVGFNALKEISKDIYKTYQYMVLNKTVVEDKIFSNEKKNYTKSTISDYFYHESNSFVDYKKGLNDDSDNISLDVFNKINKKLKSTLETDILKSYPTMIKYVEVDENYYSVTFLPIKNIKKENIGYIISYSLNTDYKGFMDEFYKKIIVAFLVILIIYISIYKTDISRQRIQELSNKERDSAIEASNAKSEFLANMSHEIRTPLNAIMGFMALLKEEVQSKKSMEYIDIILDSSKSLRQIIEDILDFSKIESGKLNIEKKDFNTKKEFNIITHLFLARCLEKNITLSIELDKNLPEVINTDSLRIKQVIANLLSNAIKFTSEGKNIKVKIDYKDALLNISVNDEGKGIAEDKLEHIFELFSQEDSSTTRMYGGTGLGLTISSALVKLLGGELKVRSTIGVGSKFYFSIPVSIGKEIEEITDDFVDVITESKKILLVEDNLANQMFMKVILKKMNFNFEIANDGVEAVERYKQNRYDIILMDENMPNKNGIEATKDILNYERENNLTHTPIIALTANALKGDRERFLEAGMDEYITKPADKKKLAEVLKKFL